MLENEASLHGKSLSAHNGKGSADFGKQLTLLGSVNPGTATLDAEGRGEQFESRFGLFPRDA
jgi:hypothetical protein